MSALTVTVETTDGQVDLFTETVPVMNGSWIYDLSVRAYSESILINNYTIVAIGIDETGMREVTPDVLQFSIRYIGPTAVSMFSVTTSTPHALLWTILLLLPIVIRLRLSRRV